MIATRPSKNLQTEEQLVLAARAGDAEAFGELVQRYSGIVTGIAYSILGDFVRSEDVGQESFWNAWRNRKSLQDPTKFAGWVCGIARHRALDAVRKERRCKEVEAPAALEQQASHESTSDAGIGDEEKALVWSTLESLPETYRETMVLYYRGEQSVQMVARSLQVPEPTIRKRLQRGRELLRSELASVVEKTLRGTTPKAIFTAAVLGSLPGNAMAATVTAAGATKTLGVKGGEVSTFGFGVVSAATMGAILGVLGGVAGTAIGAYASYRSSPYLSQRKIIVGMFLLAMFQMATFTAWIVFIAGRQATEQALAPDRYGSVISISIVTFQMILCGTVVSGLWLHRRAGQRDKASGLATAPGYQAPDIGLKHSQRYTSKRKLLGLPLLDVHQSIRRDTDGKIHPAGTAKGWIAIGDRAYAPFLAMGGVAVAPIAIGGMPIGLVALGGAALGLFALGGLAAGGVAVAGLACGVLAMGGLCIGWWTHGGAAFGQHALPEWEWFPVAIVVIVMAIPAAATFVQWRVTKLTQDTA
ncbi:MAG: sigma-70 family RNA polymerase sigma factor [Planctomycetota bacterium]